MLLNDCGPGVHSSNKFLRQRNAWIPGILNRSSVLGTRKKKSLVSTRGSPAQQLWAILTEDRSEIGPETGFHNLHVSKQETVLSYISNCCNNCRSTKCLTHVPLPLSVSSTPVVKQDPSWPYKQKGGLYLLSCFHASPEAGSMPKNYLFEHMHTRTFLQPKP